MTTITPDNLGETLRAIRNEQNVTQQQLADITGMPIHTIQRIEVGESSPSFDNLHKLVSGLNKKVVLK